MHGLQASFGSGVDTGAVGQQLSPTQPATNEQAGGTPAFDMPGGGQQTAIAQFAGY
jgi:hypothetical protein